MSVAADESTDWIGRRAALTPDRVGLIAGGERRRYGGWDERVSRVAGALRAHGVGRGDRVRVLSESSVAMLDLILACAKLGALAVLLPPRLTLAELRPLVPRGDADLLAFGAGCEAAASELSVRRGPLSIEGLDAAPFRGADAAAADPWVAVFTGGSTGVPKAAVLTHASLLANARGTVSGWGLREDDVTLADMPMCHTGGLNVLVTPLIWLGGAVVIAPRFDAASWPREATILFGVPTMLARRIEQPCGPPPVRLVITGGAPAPRALIDRYAALGYTVHCGYGLSEAGPNNFWCAPEVARAKPGAVGFPLPHVSARICDGELLLRGRHVMAGYLDDPRASAEAIRDGWLHTGDLATVDDSGVYRIVGRKKDMYISGGENVYPAEVEDALAAHPAIVEAAVIGVPDSRWGETGVAVIAAERALDVAAVRGFLRGRLAAFKLPARVVTVAALPRTPAGKVDRRRLSELVREPEHPAAAQR